MRVYSPITPGVLATIAVFLQYFIQTSIIKSLGILLVSMRDDFEVDTWAMGSIVELIECITDVLAPIAGSIGLAIGPRPAVMIGGCMVSIGFIAASRSTSILQITLYLNILIGVGYSFAHVLPRSTLALHLTDRQFSLALGIAKTGTCFSLFLLPPVVQLFLDEYGWRGALLFEGAISAHLVACGALLIHSPGQNSDNTRSDYQPLSSSTTTLRESSDNKSGTGISLKSIRLNMGKAFNLSLMKDRGFLLLLMMYVIGKISKSAWIVFFVPHAVAKGFSIRTGSDMVTFAGLGYLISSIVVSVALYKQKVTSITAMMISIILVAASLLVDPWTNSVWLVTVNAVVFMVGMASLWALCDVMLKEDLGAEKMLSAYGWIGIFSALARPVAGFLPGWIYDHTGSYDLAFIILGAFQLSALIPLIFKILNLRRGDTST